MFPCFLIPLINSERVQTEIYKYRKNEKVEHGTNGRRTLSGVFNLKYQRKRERKKKEKKDTN